MKRRFREAKSEIPAELRTFTAGDWPGRTDLERLGAWCAARRVWAGANGWPGGLVDLVREHVRVRREVAGIAGSSRRPL